MQDCIKGWGSCPKDFRILGGFKKGGRRKGRHTIVFFSLVKGWLNPLNY